jgi:phosphodiesterase/alkaline phosphatase D-like protein
MVQDGCQGAGAGEASAVKVAASLTGLRRTTTYHYRLVASNASGTTVGGDRTFSTALPPSVRTGAAQDVAATTATLTGAVDRRGRSTNWYFEYGTSTSYGARTPTHSVPSGAGARTVTAPLTRLTPGTTYHYRLVATSDAGTGRGADATFATVGVTLATPALRVVFGRGITLSGSVPVKRAGDRDGLRATIR